MKKFFILLLFPVICNGQATITEVLIAGNFQTGGIASFNCTKSAGSLYICFVGVSNSGGTPATASLSGTSETWDEIGIAGGAVTSNGRRVQAFRFYSPTTLTSNLTSFTYTGTQDGTWFNIYQITGVDVSGTNGANAIVQVIISDPTTGANPSMTLSTLQNRASVLTAWTGDNNPFSGSPESGWTITEDGGYNTPTVGGLIMKRENTIDNTPSFTAASSNWVGMVMELKASGRRVIVTN